MEATMPSLGQLGRSPMGVMPNPYALPKRSKPKQSIGTQPPALSRISRIANMNARTLGISLAVGWLILPFLACAGAFLMLDDELSVTSAAISATLFLPFIVGTAVYAAIAIKRCVALPRKSIFPRLLLLLPLLSLMGYAIFANTIPRRITPNTVSDSPFDKYWYSAPQTAYGSPFPFLRFFDDSIPDHGYPEIQDSLFDLSSLLGDLVVWAFGIFVIVSLTYTLLPPSNSGEPCDATEPGLQGFTNGKSAFPAR